MPYPIGQQTLNTIKVGPEAHKLFLEFEVSEDIHVGQPVKLHADGNKVVAAGANEPEANIIGISIHEGKSAYGDFVTVATRGYVVILAKMAADAPADPGPVKYAGYDDADAYTEPHETFGGYVTVAASVAATAAGPLAITPALHSDQFGWVLDADPGGQGAVVRVLVKN
jgi:hypothetical protein